MTKDYKSVCKTELKKWKELRRAQSTINVGGLYLIEDVSLEDNVSYKDDVVLSFSFLKKNKKLDLVKDQDILLSKEELRNLIDWYNLYFKADHKKDSPVVWTCCLFCNCLCTCSMLRFTIDNKSVFIERFQKTEYLNLLKRKFATETEVSTAEFGRFTRELQIFLHEKFDNNLK